MDDKHLTSGSSPAGSLAYQIAKSQLLSVSDLAGFCGKSGALLADESSGKTKIAVEYLNRACLVSLPEVEITAGDDKPLSPKEKLLILHYLLTARGTPPANKLITFLELPDGKVYNPTFIKRAVQPLIDKFGTAPALLLEAGKRFGGISAGLGDSSVMLKAFPRVSITMVIWGGDDEFAAQGSVLFDAGIHDYLQTEDITVLCETIAWKMVKA